MARILVPLFSFDSVFENLNNRNKLSVSDSVKNLCYLVRICKLSN